MGIKSLIDKESIRDVFIAWVREAMVGKRKEKYPYVLWYYLDVCSHVYGIDGYSPGHHSGWEAGVGKFLRDGMTEEEFAFITTKH